MPLTDIGISPKPVIKIIDIKCPDSHEGHTVDWNNIDLAESHDEFKFVISSREDYDWSKRIYLEKNNFPKLIKILDHLIEITAGEAEEIRDRGIIYYQMKSFKNALNDFETFLSMSPDSEDAEVIQQYLQVLREYDSHLN